MRSGLSRGPLLQASLLALFATAVRLLADLRDGVVVALGGDAAVYLQTAGRLARGEGLLSCEGAELISFPPLFPMVLAIPQAFGLDPIAATSVVGLFCHFLMVATCLYLIADHVDYQPFLWFGAAAFGLFQAFYSWLTGAHSEVLFAALSAQMVFHLVRYLDSGSIIRLTVVALLAAACFLTRYVGAFCLIFGGTIILLLPRSHWLQRVRHAALFSAVAMLPVLAWLGRNWLVSETFFGAREWVGAPFSGVAASYFGMLAGLFVYIPGLSTSLRSSVFALLISVAVLLVWRAGRQRFFSDAIARAIFVVAGFSGGYLLWLVALRAWLIDVEMTVRLIIPVVPLIVVAALVSTDASLRAGPLRRLRPFVVLAAVLWLWLPAKNLVASVFDLHQPPPPRLIGSPEVANSELVRFLRQAEADRRLIPVDPPSAQFLFLYLGRCFSLADQSNDDRGYRVHIPGGGTRLPEMRPQMEGPGLIFSDHVGAVYRADPPALPRN